MAYNLTRANGTSFLVLNDNVVNQDYSVTFVGKMVPNYGTAINGNYLRLLENSANANPPSKPIAGQLWYDTANIQLKFYTGTTFNTVSSLPPNTSGTTAFLSANGAGGYSWVKTSDLAASLVAAGLLTGA